MTGRPNVVLVVLDTARARDTVPAERSTTPTLARLAAEGTEYTRAFTAAPWTLPAHGSLFTGTHPSKHGAHGGHTYLDDGLSTLAEVFAAAGYETAGVSNNTWITPEFGFDRGFETFRRGWQYLQSDVDHGAVVRAKDPVRKLRTAGRVLREGSPLVTAINIGYSEFFQPRTDDGAARTTTWVDGWLADRSDSRPFFLFANYIEPHIEYRPPRECAEPFLPDGASYEEALSIRQSPRAYDVGEYDLDEREFELLRALYRGELRYVDRQLAALVESLEAAGEWEDTVFVVAGDHGENVGEHGFLGHQYNLYDTLLHVPLVVHGGAFTGGGRDGDLVSLVDLGPTLLDAADLDAARFREQSQGRSVHPGADSDPRDAVFAEYVAPQPSIDVLEERFDDVPEEVYELDRSLRAVRTEEYKYVRGSDGSEELYRVADDPGEASDRSAAEPSRADALGTRLDRWHDGFEHAAASGEVTVSDATEAHLSQLGYLQ